MIITFSRITLWLIAFFTLSVLTEADIYNHINLFSQTQLTENKVVFSVQHLFELNDDDMAEIEKKLSSMSLYEKCAQMVMPAVYRGYLNPRSREYKKIVELVKDHGVGGIVLFQGGKQEQSEFIKTMQRLSDIPLLVSGDYENGLGMRIDDAVAFPHNMAVGATFNPEFAFHIARTTAIEAKKMGINFNLAPVADVNDNPLNPIINIRAYSQDKNTVADFVSSFIKGSHEMHMLTSVKHFPGHGNTIIDSHEDIPVITGTKEYLLKNELVPFIEAIQNGVKSVMIGHLAVPSLESDKSLPATLSYNIVTKLLKEEIGFGGIIITDALDMQAVIKYFSPEEIAVKSVLAGNDILLAPVKPDETIEYIYNAVDKGIISESRIDESVRKILSAKKWIRTPLSKVSFVNNAELFDQTLLAQKIAEESVTLVKNDENILPMNLEDYPLVTNIAITDGSGGLITEYFGDLVKRKKYDASTLKLTKNSRKKDYDNAFSSALTSDLVIISSYIRVSVYKSPIEIPALQTEFINSVVNSGKKIIFISFNNPYILSEFPQLKTYINTYSNSRFSQDAVFKAMNGKSGFRGKLPVSINGTIFNPGDGISLLNLVN